MRRILAFVLMIAAGVAIAGVVAQRSARAPEPAPARATGPTASAVFAGGCFWSTESAFEHMPGVVSATSGYSGGRTANPTYSQVGDGGTGHLESVRVVYDPRQISYASLVTRFLRTIDPTDADGQFCDRATSIGPRSSSPTPPNGGPPRRPRPRPRASFAPPVATAIRPAAAFYRGRGLSSGFRAPEPDPLRHVPPRLRPRRPAAAGVEPGWVRAYAGRHGFAGCHSITIRSDRGAAARPSQIPGSGAHCQGRKTRPGRDRAAGNALDQYRHALQSRLHELLYRKLSGQRRTGLSEPRRGRGLFRPGGGAGHAGDRLHRRRTLHEPGHGRDDARGAGTRLRIAGADQCDAADAALRRRAGRNCPGAWRPSGDAGQHRSSEPGPARGGAGRRQLAKGAGRPRVAGREPAFALPSPAAAAAKRPRSAPHILVCSIPSASKSIISSCSRRWMRPPTCRRSAKAAGISSTFRPTR